MQYFFLFSLPHFHLNHSKCNKKSTNINAITLDIEKINYIRMVGGQIDLLKVVMTTCSMTMMHMQAVLGIFILRAVNNFLSFIFVYQI